MYRTKLRRKFVTAFETCLILFGLVMCAGTIILFVIGAGYLARYALE